MTVITKQSCFTIELHLSQIAIVSIADICCWYTCMRIF